MQKEDRFFLISNFLKKYEFFHQKEMMEHYPNGFGIYENWIDELMLLSRTELLSFEAELCPHSIKNPDFLNFLKEAKKLMTLEEDFQIKTKLSTEVRKKLSLKKEYEITKICEHIKDESFEKLIDIGGGLGHLAMAISHEKDVKVKSFDQEEKFQLAGKNKIKRWLPHLENKIEFIPKRFDEKTDLNDFTFSNTCLIGLHACGSLSSFLVKLVSQKKPKLFLNFGCCYHKLQNQYNLSSKAKTSPLWFGQHALTIASKCNTFMTLEDLEDKYRVKRYRYALHFLLIKKFNKRIEKIGNTHAKDFEFDFSFFAKKFAPTILSKVDEAELNSFYQDPLIQNTIERTIRAGLLRSILGRLIEIYLILDRALFLEEKGFKVEVTTLFDPKISPRNILLSAKAP